MKKELDLVKQFHQKFQVPVLESPALIPIDRSSLRHKLIQDEVDEYKEGLDNQDLPNIAKELADILYGVYGTILEHGLQDIMDDVFMEVHRSNMSKDFSQYKMVKGSDYFSADIEQFL